jgi:hypothetical protein
LTSPSALPSGLRVRGPAFGFGAIFPLRTMSAMSRALRLISSRSRWRRWAASPGPSSRRPGFFSGGREAAGGASSGLSR